MVAVDVLEPIDAIAEELVGPAGQREQHLDRLRKLRGSLTGDESEEEESEAHVATLVAHGEIARVGGMGGGIRGMA